MRTKSVIVGILFVVVAAIWVPLGRAMEADQPLAPPGEPGDLLKDSDPAWYSDGDKSKGVDACSACPCWYGYGEALFLERTNCSTNQPMIVQSVNGIPVATVLSTSDLDFDFEPGMRVVLGHRLCNGWALEGGYLSLFNANASAYAAPPDDGTNYTFPGGLGFINVASDGRFRVNYDSAMQSAELNFVCCCGCCDPCTEGKGKGKGECGNWNLYCRSFEWLVGFRFINWHEHLNIHYERTQTTGTGTGIETGEYDIRTSSNLYGPQVGARIRRWGKKWGWEATGKAGIFGSDAQQEQYVTDFDRFYVRPPTSASGGQVAFLGELNLTGIYRLTDVWNLRAGYNLIWINGIALAPDQLDFSGTIPSGNHLASDGGVLLHGVSLGVEARW